MLNSEQFCSTGQTVPSTLDMSCYFIGDETVINVAAFEGIYQFNPRSRILLKKDGHFHEMSLKVCYVTFSDFC